MSLRLAALCVVPLAAAGVLGVACSSADPKQCVAGRSEACVGAGGCSGAQVCNADGMSFGPCDCGGASSDAGPDQDAGGDAGTVDASFATPLDHPFVVSSWRLPATSAQVREFGVDLGFNTNDGVDNAFGNTVSTLMAQGFSLQSPLTRHVDDGTFIVLVNVQTESPPDARAKVFVYRGSNPTPAACTDALDPVCRGHLGGDATFEAIAVNGSMPLFGSFTAGGVVDAGTASSVLPFELGDTLLLLPVTRARTLLTMQDGGVQSGVFAGAVPQSYVESDMLPAFVDYLHQAIFRDCTMTSSPPGCGCVAGSDGNTAIALFDQPPKDCEVTAAEVKVLPNSWVPDLDTDGDGTNDAMSFGFGFTAVNADYPVP